MDYALRWAEFHQWTPRNGTGPTHADDQCCSQTYIELNLLTGKGTLEPTKENLQKQMATQEYWGGLSFPSPEDLPNPGIEPRSPALQANSLPAEPLGKPFLN